MDRSEIARRLVADLPDDMKKSAQYSIDIADEYSNSDDILVECFQRLGGGESSNLIKFSMLVVEINRLKDDIRKLTALIADS